MTTNDSTTHTSQPPVARLAMVTLDCADPGPVSDFWTAVLGWDKAYGDESYAMLTGPTHALGFGRVEGYEPPAWPDAGGRKQFHLDLAVEDIEAAEQRCVELGATVPDEQPADDADDQEGTWRVLRDPAGHPFCLTDAKSWG
ncbi:MULTISPECIES: VOC family protein [Arsenicicoccus]|uniref:VOC family protein n=1 Tax=Arsenicicoccus TaxID=267408 RepID=UPI00257BBF7F|nr:MULTISPECIES: VOC family protein [Arsenicicoccus]